jgi:hypothetical protein
VNRSNRNGPGYQRTPRDDPEMIDWVARDAGARGGVANARLQHRRRTGFFESPVESPVGPDRARDVVSFAGTTISSGTGWSSAAADDGALDLRFHQRSGGKVDQVTRSFLRGGLFQKLLEGQSVVEGASIALMFAIRATSVRLPGYSLLQLQPRLRSVPKRKQPASQTPFTEIHPCNR